MDGSIGLVHGFPHDLQRCIVATRGRASTAFPGSGFRFSPGLTLLSTFRLVELELLKEQTSPGEQFGCFPQLASYQPHAGECVG
jgi:hypothetical protein